MNKLHFHIFVHTKASMLTFTVKQIQEYIKLNADFYYAALHTFDNNKFSNE